MKTNLLRAACALSLAACSSSVRPGDGSVAFDGSVTPFPDGTVITRDGQVIRPDVTPPSDVIGRDAATPTTDVPEPTGDVTPIESLVGRWRMVTFRFDIGGTPTILTDTNTRIPADRTNMYRVNGTLNVQPGTLSFTWGILQSDHFYVSDPSIDIDDGYSGTAFYLNGVFDDASGRFTSGAFSLNLSRSRTNVLLLRNERDRWEAQYARDESGRGVPGFTTSGRAQLIDPPTSDPFVHARVALMWDMPGSTQYVETNGASITFGAGVARYEFSVPPGSGAPASTTIDGVVVAFAHVFVYDDVDNNGRYNSSMTGGSGPDVPRGVSPIGLALRGTGAGGATLASSPFREIREGFQFVNVERNSEPRPAVLVPYDHSNPANLDVPVSETPVRRRLLDLLP